MEEEEGPGLGLYYTQYIQGSAAQHPLSAVTGPKRRALSSSSSSFLFAKCLVEPHLQWLRRGKMVLSGAFHFAVSFFSLSIFPLFNKT